MWYFVTSRLRILVFYLFARSANLLSTYAIVEFDNPNFITQLNALGGGAKSPWGCLPFLMRGNVMRIAMIGCGYVGLVTGAYFADLGHTHTGIDKDADKIAGLRRGEIPIFELGRATNVHCGRPHFTTDLIAEAVFIAVGTPTKEWMPELYHPLAVNIDPAPMLVAAQ